MSTLQRVERAHASRASSVANTEKRRPCPNSAPCVGCRQGRGSPVAAAMNATVIFCLSLALAVALTLQILASTHTRAPCLASCRLLCTRLSPTRAALPPQACALFNNWWPLLTGASCSSQLPHCGVGLSPHPPPSSCHAGAVYVIVPMPYLFLGGASSGSEASYALLGGSSAGPWLVSGPPPALLAPCSLPDLLPAL